MKYFEESSEEETTKREVLSREIKAYKDYQDLKMKPNCEAYPILIGEDCRIFLESFSELYKLANDFLIKIAEPVSRPAFVHEFQIT